MTLDNENSNENRIRSSALSINAYGPRIKPQENEDGRICKLNGIKIKNPEGLDNAGLDDLKDDQYIP